MFFFFALTRRPPQVAMSAEIVFEIRSSSRTVLKPIREKQTIGTLMKTIATVFHGDFVIISKTALQAGSEDIGCFFLSCSCYLICCFFVWCCLLALLAQLLLQALEEAALPPLEPPSPSSAAAAAAAPSPAPSSPELGYKKKEEEKAGGC